VARQEDQTLLQHLRVIQDQVRHQHQRLQIRAQVVALQVLHHQDRAVVLQVRLLVVVLDQVLDQRHQVHLDHLVVQVEVVIRVALAVVQVVAVVALAEAQVDLVVVAEDLDNIRHYGKFKNFSDDSSCRVDNCGNFSK